VDNGWTEERERDEWEIDCSSDFFFPHLLLAEWMKDEREKLRKSSSSSLLSFQG
jgi:hypothetical protein